MSDIWGAGRRPTKVTTQPEERLFGLYRGVVTRTNDPAMRGRVRARVAYPFGKIETEWCEPALLPGAFFVPKVNDGIWIAFENGDPTMPVYLGQWYANAEAPLQAPYDTLQQDDEEAAHSAEDDVLHKPFHDHAASEFYTPHVRAYTSPTGHQIIFDDFRASDGSKQAMIEITDRDGRLIRLHESGLIDIAGLNGNWVRIDDAGVITVQAVAKVVVNAPDVELGDESGKALMTKDDADNIKSALDALKNHTHTSASSGSPTSPPIGSIPSYTETLTTKTKAS